MSLIEKYYARLEATGVEDHRLVAWEAGVLTHEATCKLFQDLLDSGWEPDDSAYGEAANSLLAKGLIQHYRPEPTPNEFRRELFRYLNDRTDRGREEQEAYWEEIKTLVWRGNDGPIEVQDMSDHHIAQALEMLEKDRQNPQVKQSTRFAWISALMAEQSRRRIERHERIAAAKEDLNTLWERL